MSKDSLKAKTEAFYFLTSNIETMKVIEITDGEITLKSDAGVITLYLNHELNESQKFPKSFLKTRKELWINKTRLQIEG